LLIGLLPPEGSPLGPIPWDGEILRLPEGAPRSWRNLLTGENVGRCEANDCDSGLLLQAILRNFPVALIGNEIMDT
jgi:hypothetical protein